MLREPMRPANTALLDGPQKHRQRDDGTPSLAPQSAPLAPSQPGTDWAECDHASPLWKEAMPQRPLDRGQQRLCGWEHHRRRPHATPPTHTRASGGTEDATFHLDEALTCDWARRPQPATDLPLWARAHPGQGCPGCKATLPAGDGWCPALAPGKLERKQCWASASRVHA